MVRLDDLEQSFAQHLRDLEIADIPEAPWVTPPPLTESRVAIVSTAGLHRVDDEPFGPHATDYRVIPSDVDAADILMSHLSVNFDRSGFQQDVNVCFPLEHLHTLAAEGVIGGVSRWHYAVVGAAAPERLEETASEIGRLLRKDGVDVALLVPV